nr:hypothetical protein [Tanacetum cinerariifolium]
GELSYSRVPIADPYLLLDTYCVFLNPEDKALYRGHIPSVVRVLPGHGTVIPPPPPCTHSSYVAKLKKSEKLLKKQVNMFMKLFRSDDKFSQMLTQHSSHPKCGGGSGSSGCGDDDDDS